MTALLLDQGLPYTAAQRLRELGIDTIQVADLKLAEAPDKLILDQARALRRTVCTLDADFHALMALGSHATPSVIFIRVQRLKAEAAAALIAQVCVQARDALKNAVLITVMMEGMRIRHLPMRVGE